MHLTIKYYVNHILYTHFFWNTKHLYIIYILRWFFFFQKKAQGNSFYIEFFLLLFLTPIKKQDDWEKRWKTESATATTQINQSNLFARLWWSHKLTCYRCTSKMSSNSVSYETIFCVLLFHIVHIIVSQFLFVQFLMPFIFNFLNFTPHYKLYLTPPPTSLPVRFSVSLIFLEQRIGVNVNRSIISN